MRIEIIIIMICIIITTTPTTTTTTTTMMRQWLAHVRRDDSDDEWSDEAGHRRHRVRDAEEDACVGGGDIGVIDDERAVLDADGADSQ